MKAILRTTKLTTPERKTTEAEHAVASRNGRERKTYGFGGRRGGDALNEEKVQDRKV